MSAVSENAVRLWTLGGLGLLIAFFVLFQGLNSPWQEGIEQQILLQLRLPLLLTALLVGASLSVSAACLQVLLRNPLADPGIIGINSGASLFAAVSLLVLSRFDIALHAYTLPFMCFVGALFTTLLIYRIARRLSGVGHGVILSGIAVSTVCGALIAWMYLFADAQAMRNLTFWLMGSLHQADWTVLSVASPLAIGALGYVISQGRALNRFYFGSYDAKLAGVDVVRLERRLLWLSAMLVGVAVSIAGSIAFVGLLVPHLLRMLFGHDNRFILPASALLGAALMLSVILLSRGLSLGSIPVSMLTASLGGPVFLWVLLRSRAGE